jgi:hypothetical protein
MTRPRFAPRAVLTQEQAVEIYLIRKAMRLREDQPTQQKYLTVGLAKKHNVSPKAIRDIWNRRTWTQETEHLWERNDRPMSRCTKLLSSQGEIKFTGGQSGGRKKAVIHEKAGIQDRSAMHNDGSNTQAFSLQLHHGHMYAPDRQASYPSFADVACHGINNHNSCPPTPSSNPPGYARCLRPTSSTAPNLLATTLPPPIAPWLIGPAGCLCDCAGVCTVCGAPCGGAHDPFRADWPHW